ncbi:uncharacterized protein [Hoplias malabaricus]|uniref:uncharacterized protein n=1 Tax=Hoplias malabaricus TaxID=27720 RepID=UPI003461D52A
MPYPRPPLGEKYPQTGLQYPNSAQKSAFVQQQVTTYNSSTKGLNGNLHNPCPPTFSPENTKSSGGPSLGSQYPQQAYAIQKCDPPPYTEFPEISQLPTQRSSENPSASTPLKDSQQCGNILPPPYPGPPLNYQSYNYVQGDTSASKFAEYPGVVTQQSSITVAQSAPQAVFQQPINPATVIQASNPAMVLQPGSSSLIQTVVQPRVQVLPTVVQPQVMPTVIQRVVQPRVIYQTQPANTVVYRTFY